MSDLNQLWADEMNSKVSGGTYRKELLKQYPPPTEDEMNLKVTRKEIDKIKERGFIGYEELLLSENERLEKELNREIIYKDALEQAEARIEELKEEKIGDGKCLKCGLYISHGGQR